jgi:AraC-like DNA-binding protein
MQTDISIEMGDRIIQTDDLLFRKIERKEGYNYFLGNKNIVTGHIKQLSFRDRICIEQMNYQYQLPVSKQYHTKKPFVELLYLDSIKALGRYDNNSDEFQINSGIHIYLNSGNAGELVFLSEKPIRGIRILVFEEFYHHDIKQRFPHDRLDIEDLAKYANQNYTNPSTQIIFSQIKRSMEAGVMSELYYESKIAELLFMISSKDDTIISPLQEDKHRLTNAGLLLINKVKTIIDGNLYRTPKIPELSQLVKVSPAKLQIDFQRATGCTIHNYVQKARMKEALWKIENTDEPLYEIAKSVGCKNPSRFAELFKDTFGVLPSKYRDPHRK